MDPCLALSPEMAHYLFTFLNGKELAESGVVCRAWHNLASDELLWKGLCRRKFFINRNRGQGWKDLFIERLKLEKAVKETLISHVEVNRQLVRLHKSKLRARYVGTAEGDNSFGSIQSTCPLKHLPYGDECIVAYFELKILNAGDRGHIAVGIGLNKFPRTNAPPGWRRATYGYHGDDGRLYLEAGFGKVWGPTYTTGDVIGCGINFSVGQLFFTKNGEFLGNATTTKKLCYRDQYYAIAAMHSIGSAVAINFGTEDFVFDIAAHILRLQQEPEETETEKERKRKSKAVNNKQAMKYKTNVDAENEHENESNNDLENKIKNGTDNGNENETDNANEHTLQL
jgi:hypothetical protein